jgi:signal transduction histidine kinase
MGEHGVTREAWELRLMDSTQQPVPEGPLLKLLYQISECSDAGDEPQVLLRSVLDVIVTHFEVPHAAISLFNPNNNRLEVEVAFGMPEDCWEWQLPLGVGLNGWVALHNRGLRVDDARLDSRYVELVPDMRSVVAVPLSREAIALGVLTFGDSRIGAFDEQLLLDLEQVGLAIAKLLDRVWRLEHLKNKATLYQSVVNMVGKVSNRFELDGILADITSEARRIINCEMCSLFLLSPEGATLDLEVLIARDGRRPHEEVVALSDSSMGTAVLHRKTVEVSNLAATEEHHFVGLEDRHNLVGMLCTPLIYEEQVIGVLNAYTAVPHRYSNTEKQVFRALANIGAFAIENSRLYTRIIDSENLLRQSERLTTLGTLASEIAHEIRNPLTVIRLLVESLSLDVADDDPRTKDFKVVTDNIDNLGEIVGRVLDFGKSQSQMFAKWKTCNLIEDCIRLVRFKLRRSRIHVNFERCDDTWVHCNKGQIQQVFLNLFINAEEAMPDGGQITIRSEVSDEGNQVNFYFSDTGTGIPSGIRDHVFGSFLTGKSTGTGLGLAIVKRILRDHRGNIEILDTSPGGTTFRFWLPVHHP